VKAIFKLVAKEYQAMMDKYMMGTGGGDGDEANFSNWWERDDTRTATYINGQNSNLCLVWCKPGWAKKLLNVTF
jgi:hypothetical protein